MLNAAGMTLFGLLAGGLGAIIGSFLNVVIYRLPRDEPIGMSRSKCPGCGNQIAWYDNVPILSYAILLGRCRACKQRISARYPLVEALTAGLFVLCFVRSVEQSWEPLWLAFLISSAFCAVILVAAFIDAGHQILPDKLTKRAIPLIALLGAVAVPGISGTSIFGLDLVEEGMKPGLASVLTGVAGAMVGGATVGIVRWAGSKLARREAMGMGDVKFLAACGFMLGPVGVLLALLVALVVGSVLGILIWLVTRSRAIPFGPFLALGVLAILLYREETAYLVLEAYPAAIRSIF